MTRWSRFLSTLRRIRLWFYQTPGERFELGRRYAFEALRSGDRSKVEIARDMALLSMDPDEFDDGVLDVLGNISPPERVQLPNRRRPF